MNIFLRIPAILLMLLGTYGLLMLVLFVSEDLGFPILGVGVLGLVGIILVWLALKKVTAKWLKITLLFIGVLAYFTLWGLLYIQGDRWFVAPFLYFLIFIVVVLGLIVVLIFEGIKKRMKK
jgi:hypothetical protein